MFKDRTTFRAAAAPPADQLLDQLLQSRPLRPHRFARHCEIGPFVVDYVCCERSLVVELEKERIEARTAFLTAMGYTVVHISARELRLRPRSVVARVRAALQ